MTLCRWRWSSFVLGNVKYFRIVTQTANNTTFANRLFSGLSKSSRPIAWQIILAISSSSSSTAFSRGSPHQESEREHVSGGSHQPGNPSSPHKEYPLSWPCPIFLSLSRRVRLGRLPESAFSAFLWMFILASESFGRHIFWLSKRCTLKVLFNILLHERSDAKAHERMYYCLAYFDDGDVIQGCQPFRRVRQGRA